MVTLSTIPNINGSIQKHVSRNLEKILEEAHYSGELKLNGRKLKDFPQISDAQGPVSFHLHDTVIADLSRNRFLEIPSELTSFPFLECLHLYHNHIGVIPETIIMLQSLNYLDLSRNHLISFPREICRLPLQTLLLAHNKFTALPEELGKMSALADLDISYNRVASIPPCIGELPRLRDFNIKNNLITQLPVEVTFLKLITLDISGNRISALPNELRKMTTLLNLNLADNPLTSPPPSICALGRRYIFKYLEERAGIDKRPRHEQTSFPKALDSRICRKMNVTDTTEHFIDGSRNVGEGFEDDPSFVIDHMTHEPAAETSRNNISARECDSWFKKRVASKHEGGIRYSPPEFHTTCVSSNQTPSVPQNDPLDQKKSKPVTNLSPITCGENSQSRYIQTYREYKESLKQQRANEGLSIYRSKNHPHFGGDPRNDNTIHSRRTAPVSPVLVGRKREIMSPKPEPREILTRDNFDGDMQDKYSFTIKREFERAKEEADLIQELRMHLETRLKMSLPEDLTAALADGVVLCHVANNVKPRSVASIHVPSSAVPKLPIARCRRNVDNFLEACKRIGINGDLICCASDILEGSYGIKRVAITVRELLKFSQTDSVSGMDSQSVVDGETLPEDFSTDSKENQ